MEFNRDIWRDILSHTEPGDFYNLSLVCYEAGMASLMIQSRYKSRYTYYESLLSVPFESTYRIKRTIYLKHLGQFSTPIKGVFYEDTSRAITPSKGVIIYEHPEFKHTVCETIVRIGINKYNHIVHPPYSLNFIYERYNTTNGVKTGCNYIYNNPYKVYPPGNILFSIIDQLYDSPIDGFLDKFTPNNGLSKIKYYIRGMHIVTFDVVTASLGGFLIAPIIIFGVFIAINGIYSVIDTQLKI